MTLTCHVDRGSSGGVTHGGSAKALATRCRQFSSRLAGMGDMEVESVQCKVRLGDGGVVRNATKATCNLLATALPVGTHAAVRDGKAVTQAVGACDVELSNHVWRRPPRAHGMGVVLLYRR